MAKLNQIIAVVQGKKARAEKLLTSVHHGWGKERISGISRTYAPLDEEGERLPEEHRSVQVKVEEALLKVEAELVDFINVVATQEIGNTHAKANIIVNDKPLLSDVPVSVLLFLEKRLIDLHTFVSKIPTLPTDRVWNKDDAKNCYATEPEETIKTQKVPVNFVKFAPTEHHPGQSDIINVDKTVGHWTTVHMSGALLGKDRDEMLARVEKLQDAVKIAREEANSAEVEQEKQIGKRILGFVFHGE